MPPSIVELCVPGGTEIYDTLRFSPLLGYHGLMVRKYRFQASVGSILSVWVESWMKSDPVVLRRIKHLWSITLDPQLAKHTTLVRLRNASRNRNKRNLEVHCLGGAGAMLVMQKEGLLEDIKEQLGYTHIEDIVLTRRKIPAQGK